MASTSKVDVWNRALSRIGVTDGIESEDEDRVEADVCSLHYDDLVREVLAASVWQWAKRQRPLTEIDEQISTPEEGDGTQADYDIPYAFVDISQVLVEKKVGAADYVELEAETDYTLTDASPGSLAYVTLVAGSLAVGSYIRFTVTTTRVGWEHLYQLPADCVTPVAILYLDQRLSILPEDSRIEFEILPDDAGTGLLLCCDLESDDIDGLEYVAYLDHVPLWPPKFLDAVALRLSVELASAIKKDEAMAERQMQRYLKALDSASALSGNIGHSGPPPITPSRAARGG